ncbi:unnamed protein product [Paramecium primaurelia]|uniref:Uncharacterized protein n=1 Tax=Paramecium primaurelia TaxID=5886 RepID=A0A8S1P1S0_PARPR|nr:unnamed protein product [Paramecium primaurelia]
MGYVLYSNKTDRLRTLSGKIKKILNKAQDQFQERHSNIQQGYITDLRQYCRIVTACEEQLILNLSDYNLEFIGELIKTLSGFHLLLISNLLNWIQQFELLLTPHSGNLPFEHLLEQSRKHKNRFNNINESDAAKHMNELHESIQSLAQNNKQIIDSHNTDIQNPNSVDIIDSVTQQLRDNIRSNSKSNSRIILQKLLSNQKNKNSINDQEQQTILNYMDVDYIEQQNQELRVFIDNTIKQYEDKLKQSIIQYQEAKLILKAQKIELEHQSTLLEAQNELFKQYQEKKPQQTLTHFIQVPTIADKNKRLSIDKQQKFLFTNMKLRSSSLPRIDGRDESIMRNSFTKIGVQLSKNLIPTQDVIENFKKYQQSHEFKEKVAKVCSQVQVKVPVDELQNESISHENRIMIFSKLCQVLKEKHQSCFPQCDHLNFLY